RWPALRPILTEVEVRALLMKERCLHLVLAGVSQTDHDQSTADLFEFNASHYDVFPARSRLAVVIPADPIQVALYIR
ncbi:hypothetical protein ACFL6M_07985, partial [Candidatus Eisenbacteria bacterium]